MKKILPTPYVTAVLVASVILSLSQAHAATVSRLENLASSVNEAGQSIDLVDVKCSISTANPRIIFRIDGANQWCAQEVPTLCSKEKLSVAKKVCRHSYAAQVEEYNNSLNQGTTAVEAVNAVTSTEVTEMEAQSDVDVDEIKLEKDRLEIERQKLLLRRQELELHKRQLEHERQADGVSR